MSSETRLIFTGDIGFDKYMKGRENDEHLLAEDITSFLKDSDHVIVNVEGPLYDGASSGAGSSGSALPHSMDPNVRHFLNRINADIWNICNNS